MTTLRYVMDGHGILLAPTSAFFHLQDTNQIEAVEIIEPNLWRDVAITTTSDRPQTVLLNASIPLIKEVTKSEWLAGRWQGGLPASSI